MQMKVLEKLRSSVQPKTAKDDANAGARLG